MKLQFPESLQASTFLQEYWQKKPLLIRGGLQGYRCPLEPEDLAGLACEEEIESRIVLERGGSMSWELRHGPFDEGDFADLPESHWTLLVQDVDKHVPKVASLLDAFDFLPDWRLDDIMISYATNGGSVGPHVDDYDVFLVQAGGRRHWQIHSRPVSEDDYIPGLDVRVLPEFEPEQEWVLEPGDILYLPPNIAHWGIAEGDGCVTCSVGYRTPAFTEMAIAWCDEMIRTQVPGGRYRDGQLSIQSHRAEIPAQAIDQIGELLSTFLDQDPDRRARWFGCFVTEPKEHLSIDADPETQTTHEFSHRLRQARRLDWNGWSRHLYWQGREDLDYLFVSGAEYPLSQKHRRFMQLLTGNRSIGSDSLKEWLAVPDCVQLMTQLYNQHHIQLTND